MRSRLWRRKAAVWAAALGGATPGHAAFLQDEGRTQLISGNSVSGFSRSFDPKGRLQRSASFSKTALDVDVSHGLVPTITLVGQVSLDRLAPQVAGDPGAVTGTLALAGLRAGLWRQGETQVSFQALGGVGRESGAAGFVGDLRVLAARNVTAFGMPGFGDLQLAWRHGPPDTRAEIRLDATLGLKPHERWMVLAQLFTAHALPGAGQPGGLRIKGKLSAVWHVNDRWSVQAGGFTTLYGVNTAQESGATLSVWRRF